MNEKKKQQQDEEKDNARVARYLKPLKTATLDNLVASLVASDELVLNSSFVFSFFLSSRIFQNSDELLMNIFDKTINYILNYDNKISKAGVHDGMLRLILILKEWSTYFPYDFRDVKTIETLKYVKEKSLLIDNSVQKEFQDIARHLAAQIENLEKYEDYLNKLHDEESLKLNKNYTNLLNICSDPALLASQLTLIELDRLAHIGPEEFIHYYMEKDEKMLLDKENSDAYDDSTLLRKVPARDRLTPPDAIKANPAMRSAEFRDYLESIQRTRQLEVNAKKKKPSPINYALRTSVNIDAYVLWFNRLSSFVSSEVVKNLNRKNRVAIIEFFIECASACFDLGNYNSCMSIIAGLNSFNVSRLKKTWQAVEKTKWNYLTSNLDSANNYADYRKILKARKNQIKDGKILIPISSVVMRDLRFLYNSIPNTNDKQEINVDKFWQISKYISDNIRGKNLKADFIQRNEIINHMLTEPIPTEEACSYLSFKCEPPRNEQEEKYSKKLAGKLVNY